MQRWLVSVSLARPPSREAVRGAVRALGRAPHLLAFSVAGGRVRGVVVGAEAHAEAWAARLGPLLRHALGPLGAPELGAADAVPPLAELCASADPLREDTCLPDLAGLRLVAPGCAARLRTWGPRPDVAALTAAAGWPPLDAPLPSREAVTAALAEALLATWAAPDASRCGPDTDAARAAALAVAAEAGVAPRAALAALGLRAPPDADPCEATGGALRRQLVLRAYSM